MALATQPYRRSADDHPQDLHHHQGQDRRRAWWADLDLPFQLQPFHRGFLFPRRVELFERTGEQTRPFRYRRDDFYFARVPPPPEDADLGFAGCRVLAPLNEPDRFDEVASFVGASYFRGLGRGHVYGVSARGLALGTADRGGEEFPAFRAFWFERPEPQARSIMVRALLDSPSVAGAYRFVITPGETTVFDVEATLFPRVALRTIGIAPATSMFMFAASNRAGFDDYRPAVHDSDGLLMDTGAGERIWRPLANPRTLQASGFADRDPAGFGLIQRARAFAGYEDLEAQYHRRPGLWVEPRGRWGEGEVRLVEIPTDSEVHDNIVAFWRPAEALPAGGPHRIAYRLHWISRTPPPRAGRAPAQIAATRVGAGSDQASRRFIVDVGDDGVDRLRGVTRDGLELWSSAGDLRNVTLQPNAETGGVRIAFELAPGSASIVELGARLTDAEGPVAETWLYRWTPRR